MSNKSCPISLVSVDSNIARISAFYVGIFFSIFLVSLENIIVYLLVVDFATRLFLSKEYSIIYMLSYITKDILKFRSISVDAAPKKLANYFGLFFLILISLSAFLHFTILMYSLSLVLLACIFLEVAFSYCLGCEIYHLYHRIFV